MRKTLFLLTFLSVSAYAGCPKKLVQAITLAQERPQEALPMVLDLLKTGSKSCQRGALKTRFPIDGKESPDFCFQLSPRSTAAIAAAYMPVSGEYRALDGEVFYQFSLLLASGGEWDLLPDSVYRQTGTIENNAALAEALIFAMGRRRIAGTFRLMDSYLQAHHRQPVNLDLVLVSMYRIDPNATLERWDKAHRNHPCPELQAAARNTFAQEDFQDLGL